MKRFVLLLVLLASAQAHASRMTLPMGEYVRMADCIAVADTSRTPDYGTNFKLLEIIKGDPKLKGQTIHIEPRLSTGDVHVPPDAKGVAVFFDRERKNVLEVYLKQEAVRDVRTLVRVYAMPRESQRLEALRDLAGTSEILRSQFYVDAAGMRERASLRILLDLFPRAGERGQRSIISALELMGDVRALPVLIGAMRSPRKWVALGSANALSTHFPGAAGVTDAFRRARESEILKETAAYYLARYDPDARRRMEAKKTDYQRFSGLLQEGDEAAAAPHFLRLLEDPKQTEAVIRFDAGWLEKSIGSFVHDRDRIRRAMMPILKQYARTGDYLQAASAAQVLRALRDPETVEPLRQLLERTESVSEASPRIAAYALLDLGGAAKDVAFERLRKRKDWAALRPIVELAGKPDEGAHLLEHFQKSISAEPYYYTSDAARWVYYRLGVLGEKRAIAPLVKLLEQPYWYAHDVVEALVRIGGPETEQRALALLRSSAMTDREPALAVLYPLQRERLLPELRRMVKSPARYDRVRALVYLANLGEPRDLDALVPLSDFWTGDRENHYWLMMAIAEIRRRHGYDVRGKIGV